MNTQFRSIFIVFSLFFASANLFAQGFERVYNQFPLEGEVLRGVLPTDDGGFLLLGVSGTHSPNGPRSYLQKVDCDGNFQWKKNLFADTFGLEAWKMVRQASGRLAFLAVQKDSSNSVPTYWSFTCEVDGSSPSGPHLLVASSEARKAWDIAARPSGGTVVTGRYKITSILSLAYVQTLSELGTPEQSFPIPNSDSLSLKSIFPLADGSFLAAGYFRENGDEDPFLIKLNQNGSKIWDFRQNDATTSNSDTIAFHDIALAADGNIWVLGTVNLREQGEHDTLFIQKFTPSGQPIWRNNLATHLSNLEYEGYDRSKIISLTSDGGLVILYESYEDGPGDGGEDIRLMKINAAGEVVWLRNYGREFRFIESPFDLCQTTNGFAIAAWFDDQLFSSNNGYLLRTDESGRIFSNYVHGHVFFDENLDCTAQPTEKPLAGWQIQASRQGELLFNTLTDLNGEYALPTDTGSILIKIVAPNTAWESCLPSQTINFSQPFDTATINFAMQAASDCPVLEADISTLLLRRCFPSNYTVTWSNRGTVAVPNATLQVSLDPFLEFVSSDVVPTNVSGNELFFNLNTLEIGDFGQIHLTVLVDCDSTVLGQTHCSTVKILPDDICLPSPNWSGAHIELDGNCQNDSTIFIIKNTGNNPNSQPLEYIIVEDELLLRVGKIQPLLPSQDTTIAIAAFGKTLRIDVKPEPNDPAGTHPSIAIEGCGADTTGSYSMGYVTIFPNDDGDPTSDTDCRENQGSFDPNRKDGFPRGYGESHFILPETEIEFLIQFQNTGSDTAFTVVVRDTLDKWLDPATLKMGAASHLFSTELLGLNVVKCTFSNIQLPDSSVNEMRSHGFVSFKIKPKPNTPLGTKIKNRAAIFFDFNAPVLTNQTTHKVDTGFIQLAPVSTVNPIEKLKIGLLNIKPNPIGELAILDFSNLSFLKGFVKISNAEGQILRTENVSGSSFLLERKGMPAGFYWVELVENHQVVAIGRAIFR